MEVKSDNLKIQAMLCTSLGFVTSHEHLIEKESHILQKSDQIDFMPLSLVEQQLLSQKD
mgnify:CR=1 FL=1